MKRKKDYELKKIIQEFNINLKSTNINILMSRWDFIFIEGKFKWHEPSENIIKIIEIFKKRKARKILDLGCGAGRHIVYLSRQGFDIYGLDISEEALRHAQFWLKKECLRGYLIKSDMKMMPFLTSSFDAVISVNVIYHTVLDEMKKTIYEIYRILKKNGLAFLTFKSDQSSDYAKGIKIEENTYISINKDEKGIPHHFINKREIKKLMSSFKIIEIKKEKFYDKEKNLHFHYLVLAEK